MSSWPRNDGRREERPTLPPIRDLLEDLRGPHDSRSLTLARLRVCDDSDDTSLAYAPDSSFPSRTYGNQNTGAPSDHLRRSPSPERHYQYHDHRNTHAMNSHQNSHQRGTEGRWSSASLPGHGLYSYDGRNEYHHSPPHVSRRLASRTSARRNTFDTSGYPHGHMPYQYRDDTPLNTSHQGHSRMMARLSQPGEISTSVLSGPSFDDEQTPVARYASAGPSYLPPVAQRASEDKPSGSTGSKYECSYCGKGFNRPSSLKIHLNSHTGEKPFVCPVESCGRSFSVLSNMRRHARVHSQIPAKQLEPSSDEDSENSAASYDISPLSSAGSAPSHPHYTDAPPQNWHTRRDSGPSKSSSPSSRRSHSHSSDEQPDNSGRPEKRLRGRTE